MSDGQIAVEMSLKNAKFVTGILNAVAAQGRMEDGFDRSAAKALKLEQEVKRFAETTNKVNATPLETYNQTVAKLDQSLQKNLITQDVYNRALEQAKTQMAAADGTAKRLADQEEKLRKEALDAANALKREADEVKRFADETRKVNATPIERYRDQIVRLDSALKSGSISHETYTRAVVKAKEELKNAGDANEQSFGDAALSSLASYATGIFSITAAASALASTLNGVKENADAALASVQRLAPSDAKLNQLAKSPEDLKQMQATRDALAMSGRVSREGASEIVENARNRGIDELVPVLGKISETYSPGTADLAGALVSGFKKQIDAVEAVNMAQVAAAESPLNLEKESMQAVMKASAVGFTATDISAAEAMAATSMATQSLGNTAGTYMAGYARKIGKSQKFKGKGLLEAFDMMEADPELYESVMADDAQSFDIHNALRTGRGEMLRIQALIEKSKSEAHGPNSEINQKLAQSENNPSFQARRIANAATARLEISNENSNAMDAAVSKSAYENTLSHMNEMGFSPFAKAAAGVVGKRFDYPGINPDIVRTMTSSTGLLVESLMQGPQSTEGANLTHPQNFEDLFYQRIGEDSQRDLERKQGVTVPDAILKSIDDNLKRQTELMLEEKRQIQSGTYVPNETRAKAALPATVN